MLRLFQWGSLLLLLLSHDLVKANECKELFFKGELESAQRICKQLAQDSDEISEDYQWSQLILFDVAHYLGQQEEAYQQLLTLSKLDLSNDIRYELLRRQGSYYRIKKRYMYAKSYYQDALNLAEMQNEKPKLAKSYNDLGLIFLKEKHYQLSIEYLKKSLEIKYQLKDQSLIRTTVTNLGLLYYTTGDFSEAIEYYQLAESYLLARNNNDTMSEHQLIHLYSYFAAAYHKWGKQDLAEKYLTLFESSILLLENDREILDRYLNLLELLIDTESFEFAQRILHKINLSLMQVDDNNTQLYYYMALVEFQLAQTEIAKTYALKAFSQIDIHKTALFQQELYLLMAQIEDQLKQPEQAYLWYQKYHKHMLADIQNQVDQDFKYLKYMQNQDNSRLNLIYERLNNAELAQRNYLYLLVLLVLLTVLLLVLIVFYTHRKLMIKNNLLLNKDIEKHKEICEILESMPISFKLLFKNKSLPIVVFNKKQKLLYANFSLNEDCEGRLVKTLNGPEAAYIFKTDTHPEEKIPISFDVSEFDQLKNFSHVNVQKVLSENYVIWSFCQPQTKLDLAAEINAITQFEFYLKKHLSLDILQTRKIMVDCMNLCLDIWTRTTADNRTEFAYQSAAWKINIDDGRLRTRSLDRYFSLKTIPKNPRTTQVIKSCEFILGLNQVSIQDKSRVRFYLEKLQQQ